MIAIDFTAELAPVYWMVVALLVVTGLGIATQVAWRPRLAPCRRPVPLRVLSAITALAALLVRALAPQPVRRTSKPGRPL